MTLAAAAVELLVFWLLAPALVLLHELAHTLAAALGFAALTFLSSNKRSDALSSEFAFTVDICECCRVIQHGKLLPFAAAITHPPLSLCWW